MASTTDLLPTHLALPDGAAQCHGVCVQQLAPGATPREHVFEPAEETSEALRAVSLGVLTTDLLLRVPYYLLTD